MADNINVTPGSGKTIAGDDVSGVLHQRVKISLGADGSATDALGGAGAVAAGVQRVTLASDDPAVTSLSAAATSAKQDALATLVGEVQASPTANTVLDRLKALLTGVVLATGSNTIGKVGVQVGGSDLADAHPVPVTEGNSAAPITGASMPAGGVGLTGWLSAIWTRLAGVVLAAGTAVIGKVGIDQTTDGTTNLVAAKQNGTWNVTNVSGTVALPTGAATAAKQPALGTAGTASADVITVQGIASAVAIPVTYATATRTSRSGTVTTGGTAQQLMAANSSRKGWCLQNNNTTGNIWFDETGGTAVATQPSIKLYPGDFYESPAAGATPTAISIIGDTTGMIFSAREW